MVHDPVNSSKVFPARFFRNEAGREYVREWLFDLSSDDRKSIGNDIRTAEIGWPIGMPLCRKISGHKGLWEVRTKLEGGRIARVFFCDHNGSMVLLHGFIKKSQATPAKELQTALQRMKGL